MSIQEFGEAITGSASRPVTLDVRGLEHVGLMKQTKELIFELDTANYGGRRIEKARKVAQYYADDGWTANLYFGSQNSFFIKDGKCYARTYQHRFVSPEEAENE
jgi:hypothetical protein